MIAILIDLVYTDVIKQLTHHHFHATLNSSQPTNQPQHGTITFGNHGYQWYENYRYHYQVHKVGKVAL